MLAVIKFMTNYREPTKEERLVHEYERLVDYICDGYEEIIYEYTNDLTCRSFIEEALVKKCPNIIYLKKRIDQADKKFQAILLKTKVCIFGNYPKSYFWFWGIPKNSRELMDEARINKWL